MRATICKQEHVAKKIMATDSSFEAMRLGNMLGENEEWKKDCVTHLRPILKAKMDQNPAIKAILMSEKGHFYEATTYQVFGAGLSLAQSNMICKENTTAGNKLGEELEDLREFYIRSENK